jgi:DNA ligase 1
MMKPWDIIQKLESNRSRLFKEAVIKEAAIDNNVEFFEGVKYALNSFMSFGVKAVHEAKSDGDGITWLDFQLVADKLANRELTGHAARDAINDLIYRSTRIEWNTWYRRILLKDLRCGVGEKLINTVVKKGNFQQFKVPVFDVQLAFDGEDHEKKMVGVKGIEIKLDGVRFITIAYPNGQVLHYSRNGKELINFTDINYQFKTIVHDLDQPYVFDGEIMSHTFQDLMKQVNRKLNVNTTNAKLYLFDMIPLVDFKKEYCAIKQRDRTQNLKDWYETVKDYCPNIEILGQTVIDLDTEVGRNRFNELNEKAIEGGYEGLLIKDLDAPYVLKRSHAWLKRKPTISVDLKITAIEEGTGKNKDRLGAFVCKGVDKGRTIVVNCGSGFTDAQRIDYWKHQDKLIGQTVEVMADAVSQNRDGSYSLRFPRFKTFRDDK